uniref:mRNA (guanine-N(7))-methyltransferase n=1 Tax=viral metagenome TaxID=1070528 RepID=A0A6C0D5L8_9ZZZZ
MNKERKEYGKNRNIETKTIRQKKEEFETIVRHYLESNPYIQTNRKSSELEIRFGTNTRLSRPISKINYDNVIKQLYSCGFKINNQDGLQILRINTEYTDSRTGQTKISNIRAEIMGSDLIQEYCRTNSIEHLMNLPSNTHNKLKFTQKTTAQDKSGVNIQRLDMDDFNFRVSYQTEQDYNMKAPFVQNIISKWNDSKKLFRCMNRVRFYHPDLPIFADLSIVKSSRKSNYVAIPQYTIQDAGVFDNVEQYEIELEVDNKRVGPTATVFNTVESVMVALRKSIRTVLSGLQETKYPIAYSEREIILQSYMRLIHMKNEDEDSDDEEEKPEEDKEKEKEDKESKNKYRRILPKDFIGPASFTLQLENIVEVDETTSTNVPNIRRNYAVTEKADGERKLLYISETGKIYLIDTNMNVQFTGARTSEKTIFQSLLDGEYIKLNKEGQYMHRYMAFDIYYVNKKSVREFIFLSNDEDVPVSKQRLHLLQEFTSFIKPISVLEEKGEVESKQPKHLTEFKVQCKNFYFEPSIFQSCARVLSYTKDSVYEYNIDGLIFTPTNLAVGAIKVGDKAGPLYKSTWAASFKWKPPSYNTIDFLVSVKKDKNGKDEIHHIFQESRNMDGQQDVEQYKTLILMCGFDERKHGFINPFQDILNDKLPEPSDLDNDQTYKPVPFQPTEPSDSNACFCNIRLQGPKLAMMTEEEQYFEEDMIVEFSYDPLKEEGWKWTPLRVRYDKTAELIAGLHNYGNAYHVANNNWQSIHKPITEDMLKTGEGIPTDIVGDNGDSEVYYIRSNETNTRGLRDFHNLYVKKNLIMAVSRRNDTLIDYAVGKGGDLSKWIAGKLSFVFGIDVSKDNIHNQVDGACTRFLKARRKFPDMPRALFVVGNSGLNIRTGQALATEKDKDVTQAVFGQGPKDATRLGAGVYKQYGVAENGFQISSCQFAMHYFFENSTTLHQFLRNLTECTRINGYFIATCYDGQTVFNVLNDKEKGDSLTIMKDGRKMYEITKSYDQTGFPQDEMSLGYAIDVYQESIGKVFREYLVNFEYFKKIMFDYGFVPVSKEEARHMNMPDGTGLFGELYTFMLNELKRNPKKREDYGTAMNMSDEERRISFMNRYFIFKKMREVDAKRLDEIIGKRVELVDKVGQEALESEAKVTEQTVVPTKKPKLKLKVVAKEEQPAQEVAETVEVITAPKKIKRKLKLVQFDAPSETE